MADGLQSPFDAVQYRKPLRYFSCFEGPVLGAVMIVFFNTSNTAAVSWSPSPIAIASV
jgi:hypothetical protein